MVDRNGRNAIGRASSLLVVAPEVRNASVGACASLVGAAERPIDRVVPVTVGLSPTQWRREWDAAAGEVGTVGADRATVVNVPDLRRSAAAAADGEWPGATVEPVASAAELADLGVAVSDVLQDADANGERAAVCVHTLTDLLGRADRRRAFHFAVTLAGRAARYGAVAYFHLDGDGVGRETVDAFAAACDAVVECDGDVEVYE